MSSFPKLHTHTHTHNINYLRAEHTANMNQYESTKAAIQDFVHNTCVNMRGHKSATVEKKKEKRKKHDVM